MNSEDLISIEKIRKLSLNKEDKLVVSVEVPDFNTSQKNEEFMARIFSFFKKEFPDNTVIVIPNEIELTIIGKNDEI